ncbi:ABC transporter ATP-binding protein [Burkholderia cepacia]|uniref:ABC transporter ATP-binding protein n=1 Tax=Burkholderia cepacia TaxID=292 RepID=UPI000758903B|nr:ABC transporter ATP-binding protein [Burkholderia cepacia]KVA56944.1 ABC transporter ATP-binding protein [Burkholderia cepacia]KVA67262.1 ABC transporter ATP-binding protein [Burkholderia cepacia]KVA80322.1 ABC transporter ATP-binding protein [Burkholderia cepacia]KVA92453.1 ABC transporter ATP-binding protein [Burkholderia cepacia]KVA96526.1 ABC transporter ATP-binding protein [Burkholderia cepacia]
MLRFDNLGKRFDKRVIFQGLNFASGAGCVALCDENGSGKSTLLAILAGTIDADEGEVWLGGHSLRTAPLAAKSALAYVPDDCLTYPFQTGRAFLDLVAAAKKTVVDTRTLELADRFGLAPHMDKRFEQMSLGTRKKLFLTATTLGAPTVVIADEPGNGLDAASRAVLVDLFRTLAPDRAVFFSSHDLALARACDARITRFAELGAAG